MFYFVISRNEFYRPHECETDPGTVPHLYILYMSINTEFSTYTEFSTGKNFVWFQNGIRVRIFGWVNFQIRVKGTGDRDFG